MTAKELLEKLEQKRIKMFTYLRDGQSGVLNYGYTREDAKELFSQIEAVKWAINTKYPNGVTVADEYLKAIHDGYNRPSVEGKFKDLILRNERGGFVKIKDQQVKQFCWAYFYNCSY